MGKPRVLVSWIGTADLVAAASNLTGKAKEALEGALQRPVDVTGLAPGPIETLVEEETFDRVYLLCNYRAKTYRAFQKVIGENCEVIPRKFDNPTDYGRIYEVSDEALKKIQEDYGDGNYELNIHLSSGTPAMTAIWVLLGKSRHPANFYQTERRKGTGGRAWKTEIPFDLTVDVIPELFREGDRTLQRLFELSPQEVEGFESIVGESKAIRLAVGRASRVALRDVSVLLLGESGTGKEMFARAIHGASPRRKKPFVAVNCAAVPSHLLEAELFGHKKGAFTGANRDRPGAFRRADGGTLFLDEIGECSPEFQVKLLRVLQPPPSEGPCHRVFTPLGGTAEETANVRVIAATNRDLIEMVNENDFREDLYYRLAVISIKLPPLRERKKDIPLIAEALLEKINRDLDGNGYVHKKFCESTTKVVKEHRWPGNVRELYNAILQSAVMVDGEVITGDHLRNGLAEVPGGKGLESLWDLEMGGAFDLDEILEGLQVHYVKRALDEAGGVVSKAAKLLGYSNYQKLQNQMEKFGIERE